jgi:hypothetical protein
MQYISLIFLNEQMHGAIRDCCFTITTYHLGASSPSRTANISEVTNVRWMKSHCICTITWLPVLPKTFAIVLTYFWYLFAHDICFWWVKQPRITRTDPYASRNGAKWSWRASLHSAARYILTRLKKKSEWSRKPSIDNKANKMTRRIKRMEQYVLYK